MSVYMKISDEMPKNCYECPVEEPACKLWKEMSSKDMITVRHPQCPLISDSTLSESKDALDNILHTFFGN